MVQLRNSQNNLTQKINAGGAGRAGPRQGVATGVRFDLSTMSKTEPLRIGTKSEHVKGDVYISATALLGSRGSDGPAPAASPRSKEWRKYSRFSFQKSPALNRELDDQAVRR